MLAVLTCGDMCYSQLVCGRFVECCWPNLMHLMLLMGLVGNRVAVALVSYINSSCSQQVHQYAISMRSSKCMQTSHGSFLVDPTLLYAAEARRLMAVLSIFKALHAVCMFEMK